MEFRGENSDELWDVYDRDRNLTGRFHRRGDPMVPGEYHLVVHAFIFNRKNELLIQKRQPWKKGWSGMWDISMGGSAVAGDDSRRATEREILEELGVRVDLSQDRPRFTIYFPDGFDDYWVIHKDLSLEEIHPQEEEVEQVKWATKEEILLMMEEGIFIPYFFMDHIFEMQDRRGARLYQDPTK